MSRFDALAGASALPSREQPGAEQAGYSPFVAYVDQFDRLIRADERGRAIKNTRTIVVFDDGLVVCVVRVSADSRPPNGLLVGLLRTRRAGHGSAGGDDQIRVTAQAAGSSLTFAPAWPRARLIPVAVIDRIVLTRPRQVSELAIYEQTADLAGPAVSVYLGDLSADRVRGALEPVLGDRLEIRVP
jgi:hypothetical protein